MGGKRDYEDIKIHGKDFSAQIPVRTFRIQDMIAIFQVDASVPIVLNGEKRVIINRKSWCALQTVANWCATANLFSFHTSHGNCWCAIEKNDLGKHSFKKKAEFYEKFSQTGGGVNRISCLLFRNTYIPEIQ